MDPIVAVDPAGDDDTVDPIVTSLLLLCAMMETFMTTQVTHRQFINELLTEVATLRADFVLDRSAFPPSPPFDP